MRMTCKLTFGYMKYYGRRTGLIFASIIMVSALLTMVNIFQYSGKLSNIEYTRGVNGDFHLAFTVDEETSEKIYREYKKYNAEKIGMIKNGGDFGALPSLEYVYVDSGYKDIFRWMKLMKGHMPYEENEIVMSDGILAKFGIEGKLGENVTLGQKNYRLSGILEDKYFDNGKSKPYPRVYCFKSVVSKNNSYPQVFIKFDESGDIEKDLNNFKRDYGIENKQISVNRVLLESLGVHLPYNLGEETDYRKMALWQQVLTLQYNTGLIILLTGIFAMFIVYSIFHISILQRIRDYGIMEAEGIGNARLFGMLLIELFSLLLVGYPIGCLSGIGLAGILYPHFAGVFNDLEIQIVPMDLSFSLLGTVFFVFAALFILIVFTQMNELRKIPILDAIQKVTERKGNKGKKRKIYCMKYRKLTSILVFKNMVRRKSVFICILISLSLGGMIILITDYIAVQTRKNYELTLKADDGLSSDYMIEMENLDFAPGISEKKVKELESLEGIKSVHPVRYYLGGILLDEKKLLMKNFFDYDYTIGNHTGTDMGWVGDIWTKENEEGQYLLKSEVYGYDDIMLDKMKEDYLIEGDPDSELFQQDNAVILRMPPDGAGNYACIDVHPGDKIQIKYQKKKKADKVLMKFPVEQQYQQEYEIKEFIVAGVAKSSMAASNNYFEYSKLSVVAFAMENAKFEKIFGVSDYKMVSVIKHEDADAGWMADQINQVVKDIKDCELGDYAIWVLRQNRHLKSQLLFIYGIMAILFAVTLIYMAGSISNMLLARKNEYAVLRALGITDKKFWGMMIKEGVLYGVISSVIMIIGALVVQWVVYRFLSIVYYYEDAEYSVHIFLYLCMTGVNILLSVCAVILPYRQILSANITEAISRTE